jgi:hydroxypyruvate reductase
MEPHVLLIEPMMPEVEAQLDAAYCVHRLFAAHDRAALIASIGSSVRAIVTGGAHGASNDIVDALPRLEIIAINGIGSDALDLERARARSVRVTTTPDVLTDDVADLALGLMLATSRRICVAAIDPDEAYRLQYQARRDGHFAEEHYWARYRQGLEERGPRR